MGAVGIPHCCCRSTEDGRRDAEDYAKGGDAAREGNEGKEVEDRLKRLSGYFSFMVFALIFLCILLAVVFSIVLLLLQKTKQSFSDDLKREKETLRLMASADVERTINQRRIQLEESIDQRRLKLEEGYRIATTNAITRWEANERNKICANATQKAELDLARWKAEMEEAIRKDAVTKSISVVRGKMTEHLIPYMGRFPFDPRDCRFIGAPIDMVVFDGLYGSGLREVVFLEIKTGKSSLNTREQELRTAIQEGRVRWEQIRIPNEEFNEKDSPS